MPHFEVSRISFPLQYTTILTVPVPLVRAEQNNSKRWKRHACFFSFFFLALLLFRDPVSVHHNLVAGLIAYIYIFAQRDQVDGIESITGDSDCSRRLNHVVVFL